VNREDESREVSRLLAAAEDGEPVDLGALLPLVYDHLRAIAARHMGGERKGHTLQPTALVHEAYLKLVGQTPLSWSGKSRFYAAAAEAMRRILIDHARGKRSAKRGGGRRGFPLSVVDLATRENFEEIVAVDDAVSRLERRDGELADVVKVRFYAGLTEREAAEALGRGERTVSRQWALARAWLERELTGE
jgi:RNA polymerase sigma factor (TIGR02999 family)